MRYRQCPVPAMTLSLDPSLTPPAGRSWVHRARLGVNWAPACTAELVDTSPYLAVPGLPVRVKDDERGSPWTVPMTC